jgi:hypothetical protein
LRRFSSVKIFFGFTLRALMKRSSRESFYCLSAMIPSTSR